MVFNYFDNCIRYIANIVTAEHILIISIMNFYYYICFFHIIILHLIIHYYSFSMFSEEYEFVKVLGEGSSGRVHLVKDIKTGSLFAHKIIPLAGFTVIETQKLLQ